VTDAASHQAPGGSTGRRSARAGLHLRGVSLAWRNVTFNPRRLIRAASGIAFAVVMMFIQLGFRNAFLDSATAVVRAVDADLMIVSAQKIRFSGARMSFPRRQLYRAASLPEVASARPLYAEWDGTWWKNPQDQRAFPIQVLAFDPDQPVLSIAGINSYLAELKQPNTVLVDSRARRFLGDMQVGLETELGSRQVRIIGTFDLGPDFTVDGTVIMSDRNFLDFFGERTTASPVLSEVEFGIVKLKPGADAAAVQGKLRQLLGAEVAVMTKAQFLATEIAYQSSATPVGPIFALGTVIGFVVGMLITYQIMFADVSNQLPQYATLKAMGYSTRYLAVSVLQQATLYGIAGFVPAWLISVGLYGVIGHLTLLPIAMTPALSAAGLLLTVGMCVASGLMAIRRVNRVDPADLFR
jgi:putative ABC transport system permease protein